MAVLKSTRTYTEIPAPAARVVTLPGANYCVYLSNQADVLREMRTFLAALRH